MKTLSCLLFVVLLEVGLCQRRIFGGSDAIDGMFPYAAYILIDQKGSCTGSLLSSSWVLTAAHCIDGNKPQVKVVAGSADKTSSEAQVRYGDKVLLHPKYIRNTMAAYDIALVKLNTPFNLSAPGIGTMSLSDTEWPQNNQLKTLCTALGWGRISSQGKAPNKLQHLEVVARHGAQGCPCVKRFEQKKLVCLEGVTGKGPCMGDSGGPLICKGRQVGITHMGFTKEKCNPVYPYVPKMDCGQEDTVVSYMYLCPELDWISNYVPSIPVTPHSCSAFVNRRPDFGLTMILLYILFQ